FSTGTSGRPFLAANFPTAAKLSSIPDSGSRSPSCWLLSDFGRNSVCGVKPSDTCSGCSAAYRVRGLGGLRIPSHRPPCPNLSRSGEGERRSPGVFGSLLLFGFRFRSRSGRQLQHRCRLTFLETGQQDLLAVRHFQDVVMDARLVLVSLPEDRGGESFEALTL